MPTTISPEDRAAIVQDVLAAIQQMGADMPPGEDDLPGADDAPGGDDNPEVHVHVHDNDDDDDPEQYDAAGAAAPSATNGHIPDGMAMDRYGRYYQIAPAERTPPAPAPAPKPAPPARTPQPPGPKLVRNGRPPAVATSGVAPGDTQVQLIRLQREVGNLKKENRELRSGVETVQRERRKLARYQRLQALEDEGVDLNAQEWLDKLIDLPDADFEERFSMLERFERKPSRDLIPVGHGGGNHGADETEELERFKRQKRQEGVVLRGPELMRAFREHKQGQPVRA